MSSRIYVVLIAVLLAIGAIYWLVSNRAMPTSTPRGVRVKPTAVDFNGDRRSDWAVVRETDGALTWFVSNQGGQVTTAWGQRGDRLVPADYDGDGRTDLAVWRAGTFYVQPSSGRETTQAWGQADDDPMVVGDYDGDGRADFAVYRAGAPSRWFILKSSDGKSTEQPFGQTGDVPAPGDYDGDGRVDIAVKRAPSGDGAATFHLLQSTAGLADVPWGLGADVVVTGDYDGDGKADIAVARHEGAALVFYVRRSSDTTMLTQPWGQQGDTPAPGDYDGDRRTDFAVWRPASTNGAGTFYVLKSGGGELAQAWGQRDDVLPAAVAVR
jgi:hypothetical protein